MAEMRKLMAPFVMLALVVLALPGPGEGQSEGPVRLGLIDMYSGGFAAQAAAIRTGFEIAVNEANAAGGIGGRRFSVDSADMGISVEKATTEARRMILEEKVRYVTVGSHSGAAVALAELAKQYKVFGLGGFATTKRFTGEVGHALVGRANLSTVEIGRVMAEYLADQRDVKRIAVIAPDFEYGQHFAADFVAHLKTVRPDIIVVRQEWPKFGAADFTPHVTALQASPVDLVVSGLFSGDLLNFLKSARGFNLFGTKTRFFTHGLDLIKPSTFKDLLPDGTVATVWYPFYAIKSRASERFDKEIEKATGSYPLGSSVVGYIAGRMLTAAIQRAGSADDVTAVARAMGGLTFESPVGPVKVRACDNMALYDFYVGRVTRDPTLPDGIGVTDVKAYNTERVARSCEEIERVRKS